MKSWKIGSQEGLDSLHITDEPDPIAGYGEAVVAMRAFALNHRDLLIMRRRYGAIRPEDRIPVSDGVGEVISIGEKVTNVKPGDIVCPTHFADWQDGDFDPSYFQNDLGSTVDGLLSEKVLLPASCLVKAAKNLSNEENATLPVVGATVWACLQTLGEIKAGDTVLMLGTGGVSVFALQLALTNGAKVVITSSSDEKLSRMKELGAEVTVNYKTNENWDQLILDKTGGVDIVVETGGLGTLEQSINTCKPNARIGLIGGLSGRDKQPNLGGLLMKNLILKGITSGSRKMLEGCISAVEINNLRPVIDKVYDFKKANEAYKYLDSGSHIGKVVIKI